jgi:uncharacterized protein
MILRFLWYLLLGFLVFKLIQALRGSLMPPRNSSNQGPGGKGEKMVKDPQCGTYVPQSEALTETVAGKTHYFCSPECREKFLSK